ncbi:MAG: N-6 DNA methylase [Anaerolineae bacterium]
MDDNAKLLAIYRIFEQANDYLALAEVADRLDPGLGITQAELRELMSASLAFRSIDGCWDLRIYRHFDSLDPFQDKHRRFDPQKFTDKVVRQALVLRGAPSDFGHLSECVYRAARYLGQERLFPADQLANRVLRTLSRSDIIQYERGWYGLAVWRKPPEVKPVLIDFASAEALQRIRRFLKDRGASSTRTTRILQGVFKIGSDHSLFAQANSALEKVLTDYPNEFMQTRVQQWMLAEFVPEEIDFEPPGIPIPRWVNPDEERLVQELETWEPEELVDASIEELEEEEEPKEVVFDPSYIGPLKFVLLYRLRQAGVLKINQRERRLFPTVPTKVELTFEDQYGGHFKAWLNNATNYLYGHDGSLAQWFAQNLVPAGGVFYIERAAGSEYYFKIYIKTSDAHSFEGKTFYCEIDPETYIEEDRLKDLVELRKKVEAARKTIRDAVIDVFELHGEGGLHYRRVWSEVHVIRPTTRRTVAAILSAFPCFYQKQKGSGVWFYNSAKRNLAPHKSRKQQALDQAKKVERAELKKVPRKRAPRKARYWVVPTSALAWSRLGTVSESDPQTRFVPWPASRSSLRKGDTAIFYNPKRRIFVASMEVARPPIRSDGETQVTVRPRLEEFHLVPFADVHERVSFTPSDQVTEILEADARLILAELAKIPIFPPTEIPDLKTLVAHFEPPMLVDWQVKQLQIGDLGANLDVYLVQRYPDRNRARYVTPRTVIDFMVALANPKPTDRIIDISCGTGGFLVRTLYEIQKMASSDDIKRCCYYRVFGMDIESIAVDAARLNLHAHGFACPNIYQVDSLTDALFAIEGVDLDHFDVVIGNPQFGGGKEIAFMRRYLELARPGGRIVVNVAQGILCNAGLQPMRDEILRQTHVKAIISLPRPTARQSAFYGAKSNVIYLVKKLDVKEPQTEPAILTVADNLVDDLETIKYQLALRT